MKLSSPFFAALAAPALLVLLAGCGEDAVAGYRVPKEAPTAAVPAERAAVASGTLHWTAPATWQSQPAGGLRLASFLVADAVGGSADISVVSFPGGGGDDLANINRWRGQLGLAPVSAAELPALLANCPTSAGTWVLADLKGDLPAKGPSRLLGAWLRQPTQVWFVKMMGPADLVLAQKEAFSAFLASFAGGAAIPAEAATPHPSVGGMDSMPVQSDSGVSLVWSAPAGWTAESGHPMRKGSYALSNGGDVAITAFPGDVGGVLANVNRWRGQAGLTQIDEAALASSTSPLDSRGLHFLIVDAQGGSAPIVAALLPFNGATWFFKLTGPAAAVAQSKPAFLTFLQTVRSP